MSIIEKAYTELNKNYGITESEYSTEWLGMSKSYYSYIKTTNNTPSIKSLVALYGATICRKDDLEVAHILSESILQSLTEKAISYHKP
jgi:hypothetical protein